MKRKSGSAQSQCQDKKRSKLPARKLEIAEESELNVAEEVEQDSCTYESLLTSLRSSSGTFAQIYSKREREQEGVSSSDEGEEEEEEENDQQEVNASGSVNGDLSDSDISEDTLREEAKKEEHEDVEAAQSLQSLSEEANSDDDGEEEQSNLSGRKSSFHRHMEHSLADEDVQKLKGCKSKYKYKFPAHGKPKSKWMTTNDDFIKDKSFLSSYGIKMRLAKHWQSIHKHSDYGDFVSAEQCELFSFCNSYHDILHSNKVSFMGKSQDDESSIMDAYLLHILNHVYETRDLVMKNNERLNQQSNNEIERMETLELPRDQGFTRPKVLIMLPFRSIALKVVKNMIRLIPSSCKVNVEFMDRFVDEFGDKDDEVDDAVENGSKSKDVGKGKVQSSSKPADYQALFGGNNDDHFRMGIKITKKSVKLFSDFYSSDIIVASPIGLITKIGEAEVEKDKDVDFLSSIEILLIDYADVILMQNWSHVTSVVDVLNQTPKKQHGADFMRIREWYLNDQARYFRQSIILTRFVNEEINSLFNRACQNYHGKIKLASTFDGVLPRVLRQVCQVYERFDCDSILDVDEKRFEFFVKKIFPKIKDSLQGGVMLFTSSYFEFVRLRNFLKSQSASFCLLGEYTKQSDISRARTWFFHGDRKIMLYTERAHFYHRYKIRGIRDLIFYSLPEREDFYTEITNMFEGFSNPSCRVFFSVYDNLRLERIVGTSSAKRMLTSPMKLFTFC